MTCQFTTYLIQILRSPGKKYLCGCENLNTHLAIYNPSEWLDRLESLKGEKAEHPAKKLIGLWRGAFDKQNEPPKENNDEEGHKDQKEDANLSTFRFDTTRTEAALGHGDLRLDMPVSKELFTKIWVWIRDQQS